jgi:hypothetical protein
MTADNSAVDRDQLGYQNKESNKQGRKEVAGICRRPNRERHGQFHRHPSIHNVFDRAFKDRPTSKGETKIGPSAERKEQNIRNNEHRRVDIRKLKPNRNRAGCNHQQSQSG